MLIGKQIAGLCLLFSSKRVCCHCGARHNHNINLCETELECANRLQLFDLLLLFSNLMDKCCKLITAQQRRNMTTFDQTDVFVRCFYFLIIFYGDFNHCPDIVIIFSLYQIERYLILRPVRY